jgi:hypothetical protein
MFDHVRLHFSDLSKAIIIDKYIGHLKVRFYYHRDILAQKAALQANIAHLCIDFFFKVYDLCHVQTSN